MNLIHNQMVGRIRRARGPAQFPTVTCILVSFQAAIEIKRLEIETLYNSLDQTKSDLDSKETDLTRLKGILEERDSQLQEQTRDMKEFEIRFNNVMDEGTALAKDKDALSARYSLIIKPNHKHIIPQRHQPFLTSSRRPPSPPPPKLNPTSSQPPKKISPPPKLNPTSKVILRKFHLFY